MKTTNNKSNTVFSKAGLIGMMCGSMLFCSCEDFLEPKPLSFYEPASTFTTEAGLEAKYLD